LTSFHGVSHHTSSRILARLQIHEQALVSSLTEQQVTALSAFLSSPSNTPVPSPTPVCPPGATPHGDWSGFPQPRTTKGKARMDGEDPLQNLKIETDLRRSVQSDIAHMRTIGTYKGRRYAFDAIQTSFFSRLISYSLPSLQARSGIACTRSEHTDKRQNSEEAQQGGQENIFNVSGSLLMAYHLTFQIIRMTDTFC
jgi:small subunit ribosomal protein S13